MAIETQTGAVQSELLRQLRKAARIAQRFAQNAEPITGAQGAPINVQLSALFAALAAAGAVSAGAVFTYAQLGEQYKIFQRSTSTGGTAGKGAGTIPVTLNVTTPGTIKARLRNASGTVLGYSDTVNVPAVGAQTVNFTNCAAVLDWFYVDLSADGVTYQNGTTLVGMGRLVAISGQSQAVRCIGMLSPAVTTITAMGLTVPDFGAVFATFVDDQKTVTTPAWAKPATGTNYDSPFLPVFLEREIAVHGVNVGVIGHAVGATKVDQWVPGTTNHTKFLSTLSLAGSGFEALHWHLGGTDSAAGTTAASYKSNLALVLNSYKAANTVVTTNYPEIITATGNRLAGSGNTVVQVQSIRLGAKEFAAGRPKGFYFEPHDLGLAGDKVHQDSPGDVSLARGLHRAFNAQRLGYSVAGPILLSGTRATGSTDIVVPVQLLTGAAALVLAGAPKSRFTVLPSGTTPVEAGTGALAISGVAIATNPVRLVLSLSAAPADTQALDVYFGLYPDPTANGFTDMVRDDYVADGITYGRQLEATTSGPLVVAAPGGGGGTPVDPGVGQVYQLNTYNSSADTVVAPSGIVGWNDIDQQTATTAAPKSLVDSTGAATTAKASISNTTLKGSQNDTTAYPGPVPKSVADTYIYIDKANTLTNGAASSATLAVTGLVAGAQYTVQLYALRVNTAGRAENFTVNGVTKQGNVGTGGTPSTWTAEFTAVVATDGNISIVIAQNGTENYAYLSAAKLTRTA